ncbi:DNA polymerase III subunit delta' [Orbaceae bacterium ac157xtp]
MVMNNLQLNAFPWLNKAYQTLTLPILQQRAHHALLINYIVGSGENELIYNVIARLFCVSPKDNQPCGECHSCKLYLAENHPDFYQIECEKGKQSIGVEQIRQVTAKIYERAQQGGNKVIWIKTASLMTESAANAVLKTLEEPPENTFFILSSKHNSELLPTIRSRCQYFFLSVPDLDNSIAWLQANQSNFNTNEIATALLLSENAPLAAQALLNDESWQNRQEFCEKIQKHMANYDFWYLRDLFINQDNLLQRMGWFVSLISDGLKARQKSGRFIINRDQVPLVRLFASLGATKLIDLYALWDNAQYQLGQITGLNQELMVSNLLAQSELIATS